MANSWCTLQFWADMLLISFLEYADLYDPVVLVNIFVTTAIFLKTVINEKRLEIMVERYNRRLLHFQENARGDNIQWLMSKTLLIMLFVINFERIIVFLKELKLLITKIVFPTPLEDVIYPLFFTIYINNFFYACYFTSNFIEFCTVQIFKYLLPTRYN